MIREVLAVLKINQGKVYLNSKIKKKFNLMENTDVVWAINENSELVLIKANSINRDRDLSSMY